MDKLIGILTAPNLWVSAAVLVVGLVLMLLMKKYVRRHLNKESVYGKKETNIRFLANAIKYIIMVFMIVLILQVNGVNVGSLVAGLGIVGIVVGFALQDILKDLIMGTNIVWDNFFSVGDVVQYGGIEGEVIYFNIKVTRIRNIVNGNVLTISNRNISEIAIVSKIKDIMVPAPYEEPAKKMRKICEEICVKMVESDEIDTATFLGTYEFADSQINYLIRINCKPQNRGMAGVRAHEAIQDVYAIHGIEIPYPQMDVHLDK